MEEEKKQDEPQIEEIPKEEPKIEEEKERICPYCKQVYKTKVGLNNWKNLFRKPTLDDWITLFILIMLFFASYAYIQETKTCREMVNNLEPTCAKYNAWKNNLTKDETSVDNPLIMPNFTNSTEVIGGEKDENGCENCSRTNITISNYSNASS